MLAALVAEVMKRSAIAWLEYDGSGWPRGVWHVWHEGAAYVVSGGEEQLLPSIEHAQRVAVTARAKDTRERLVVWIARASTLVAGTAEWQAAVDVLRPQRLNAVDADRVADRWSKHSTITRLEPTGEVTEHPGAYPHGSLAAAPVPSPATTTGRPPAVIHRRQRRAPDLHSG
jgi:hypothetical protein